MNKRDLPFKIRILSLILISVMAVIAANVIIYQNIGYNQKTQAVYAQSTEFPELVVRKEIVKENRSYAKTEVQINETFTLLVTIKNIGNAPAYNVTVNDTFFPEWVFELLTELILPSFWKIDNNTQVSFGFTFIAKKTGLYTFKPAKVVYWSQPTNNPNAQKYVTYSSKAILEVSPLPPETTPLFTLFQEGLTGISLLVTLLLIFYIISLLLSKTPKPQAATKK